MAIGKTSWQIPTAAIALAIGYLAPGAMLAAENKGEIPEPKTVSLTTKDGMALKATYYGSNRRKEAVPVILLHDFKGNRHELDGLARWLQKDLGHAVIVPDLRGHGDSKQLTMPGSGKTVELTPDKLRKPDFVNMILLDMEAVRKFLVGENDAGNLNLNQVCVVGAGMGASVALNWAARDWAAPRLAVAKQGQDVKGLVLISPAMSFKGINVRDALKQPGIQREVSMLIVHGKRTSRDAQRIHKMVARFHPDLKPSDADYQEQQDLFLRRVDRDVAATRLLVDTRTGVDTMLQHFLTMRLVNKDFEWVKRAID